MPPSSLPYTRGNRKKNSTSVSTNGLIIIISCYPDYSGKNIKPDQNETIVSIPVLPFPMPVCPGTGIQGVPISGR